mgnify:CR=1 FL=1
MLSSKSLPISSHAAANALRWAFFHAARVPSPSAAAQSAVTSNDPKADVEELLSVERAFVKDLKNITARQCFSSNEVLNLELTGDKVISTLLDVFVRTLTEHDGHELSDTRTYAGKIFRKISRNFIYIAESKINDSNYVGNLYSEDLINKLSVYDRLHLVVDYVSGMTDSYAVKVYQELTAMKHP